MTTVAATLESMAGDHRVTGDAVPCHVKKLYRVGDAIYGICGDVMMALYVIEWLQGKRDKESLHKAIGPDHRANITIMELSHDGLALIDGWGMRMPIMDRFYAIGSGAASAMADMRRGLTPLDAVCGAPAQDEASGLHPEFPPHEEYLLPPALLPKRKRRGK